MIVRACFLLLREDTFEHGKWEPNGVERENNYPFLGEESWRVVEIDIAYQEVLKGK